MINVSISSMIAALQRLRSLRQLKMKRDLIELSYLRSLFIDDG
jgi:hypothetical protein